MNRVQSNRGDDSLLDVRSTLLVLAGLGVTVISIYAAAPRSAAKPPALKVRPLHELINGRIATNGLPLFDLTKGALTSTALSSEPIASNILGDPYQRELMKYAIECALPETATVTASNGVESIDYHGSLGLAPEWADGACGVPCQEWVSACLLARSNYYGVTVALYFDGNNPAFDAEQPPEGYGNYSVEEGAFFGNVFLDPSRQYSCRGGGSDPLSMSFRLCTKPGHICGIQSVGFCGDINGETGEPSKRHVCSERDARGNYIKCRNRPTLEGTNEFPEPSLEFTRVITTRVRRTTFNDGVIAGECVAPPEPPEVPAITRFEGSSAGQRCNTDDDCASASLVCDVSFPNYMCTGSCNDSSRADYEEADCDGPGSACLELSGTRFCTHACTTGQPQGSERGCERGQVCYDGWLSGITDDRAGCFRLCSQNSDCERGASCDTRTGACGFETDLSLTEDGLPCDATSVERVCRGACFPLVDGNPTGVCVSVINTVVTPQCPDAPDLIEPLNRGVGDLAACAFRRCDNNTDCVAPLVCAPGLTGENVCTVN